MKPEFPIVQIEIEEWELDIMMELFLFDEYYYSRDEEFYSQYIYGKRFLDSNGRILIAGEKIKLDRFWSKLGFGKQYKITFEDTGDEWSFDTTLEFLVSKINQDANGPGTKEWLAALDRAKTIKQLIEAER